MKRDAVLPSPLVGKGPGEGAALRQRLFPRMRSAGPRFDTDAPNASCERALRATAADDFSHPLNSSTV